jgi:hypothetical protein
MALPSLGMILVVWGLLAPVGVYGWQKAGEFFRTRAAVNSATTALKKDLETKHTAQIERLRAAHQGQLEAIRKELADDTARQVEEARAAAAAVPDATASGLRELCRSDTNCRSREVAADRKR